MTVGAKRVRRLMRKMGLMAIYPQKCLSKGESLSTSIRICYAILG